MYERQDGRARWRSARYAHRSILHDPEDIPSIEAAALSPTEFPFTQTDFDPQLEDALDLMPEIARRRDGRREVRDQRPASRSRRTGCRCSARRPRCKGLWSAAAVWVKEGPGVGKIVAEWMVHGEPALSTCTRPTSAASTPHQKTRAPHPRRARSRHFPKTYGIVHPREQWASDRNLRHLADARAAAGARRRLLRGRGLGAAAVVRGRTRRSSSSYGVAEPRRGGVGRALVVADHQRRAPRDARARRHLRPLARSRSSTSTAPGALDALQRAVLAQMDVAGRARRLHAGARPARRLQVRPDDHAARRRLVPDRHRRRARDGRPKLFARPPAGGRLGEPRRRDDGAGRRSASGGRARATSSRRVDVRRRRRTRASRSARAGRSRSARSSCSPRGSRTSATSAGSSTCRSSRARGCGTSLWEAGQPHGLVACGIGVYGDDRPPREVLPRVSPPSSRASTRRRGRHAAPEGQGAGLRRQGGHLRHREEEPAAILCTLTVDDHASASGVDRYPLGREPITLARRHAAHRPQGPPLVRDERRAPARRSASTSCMAYLPPEHAVEGSQELAVEYMTERFPVTVDVVGSRPIFDPENTRIRS